MEAAKKLYSDLCAEFGEGSMNIYTNGWKHLLIYDLIKEGTIDGFIKSLF